MSSNLMSIMAGTSTSGTKLNIPSYTVTNISGPFVTGQRSHTWYSTSIGNVQYVVTEVITVYGNHFTVNITKTDDAIVEARAVSHRTYGYTNVDLLGKADDVAKTWVSSGMCNVMTLQEFIDKAGLR